MARTVQTKEQVNKPENRGTSRITRLILIIAFLGFAVYAVISILKLSTQIAEKRSEYNEIQEQIKIQQIKNDEMEELSNYKGNQLSEYIEQLAREELDYVKSGERVFVNVSGD